MVQDRFLELARRLGLAEVRCPVCSVPGEGLCAPCRSSLAPRRGGLCPMCGAVFGRPEDEPVLCGDCRREPRPWDRLFFHGPYQGRLRDLILSYKFGQRLGLGALLQDLAARAFLESGHPPPDLIAPVPLHPRRLVWRGYNQSLELCRLLSRRLDRPVRPDALARIRRTRPQTGLSGPERRENIQGAFRADPGRVGGASVLLVDDVVTTGATVEECARTLKAAGAAQVLVLAVART